MSECSGSSNESSLRPTPLSSSGGGRVRTIDTSGLDEAAEKFRPHGWTSEQRAILSTYYGRVPTKMLAKKLGKLPSTIREYASNHGIYYNRGD